MSEKLLVENFERIEYYESGKNLAETSILLGRVAMQFSRVERAPRYEDSKRESDVEHSFMLAMVAPELAKSLELDLDTGLLSQYAIVHDLVELKTKDTPTLLLDASELKQKEELEAEALDELLRELPPYTAHLLARYELQEEPEARFVRFVDKLLPLVVDIIGDGTRVLQDDYNIHSHSELRAVHDKVHERLETKFGKEFPEISDTHKKLVEVLLSSITFDK